MHATLPVPGTVSLSCKNEHKPRREPTLSSAAQMPLKRVLCRLVMHRALSSLALFLVKLKLNPDRMIFIGGFNEFTEHHFHEFEATATRIGAHKTRSAFAKQDVRSFRLCAGLRGILMGRLSDAMAISRGIWILKERPQDFFSGVANYEVWRTGFEGRIPSWE